MKVILYFDEKSRNGKEKTKELDLQGDELASFLSADTICYGSHLLDVEKRFLFCVKDGTRMCIFTKHK